MLRVQLQFERNVDYFSENKQFFSPSILCESGVCGFVGLSLNRPREKKGTMENLYFYMNLIEWKHCRKDWKWSTERAWNSISVWNFPAVAFGLKISIIEMKFVSIYQITRVCMFIVRALNLNYLRNALALTHFFEMANTFNGCCEKKHSVKLGETFCRQSSLYSLYHFSQGWDIYRVVANMWHSPKLNLVNKI